MSAEKLLEEALASLMLESKTHSALTAGVPVEEVEDPHSSVHIHQTMASNSSEIAKKIKPIVAEYKRGNARAMNPLLQQLSDEELDKLIAEGKI